MFNNLKNIKKAFTLAEILITLGIIGIVAAYTIPTVIQKQQEAQTIAKLKKVYSTLSNAYNLALQENGPPEYWGGETDDGPSSKIYMNILAKYLNIQKNCGNSSGCFAPNPYRTLDGGYDDYMNLNHYSGGSAIILSDGTFILLDIVSDLDYRKTNNRYANIIVDVNGYKSPNQFGIDTFVFIISKNKIVSGGQGNIIWGSLSFPAYCDKNKTTSQNNGRACTGWVIYNENMDYLHCQGLSWNGPQSCQ